jgi:hypothetical protein
VQGAAEALDWTRLLGMAEDHRIAPTVWQALLDAEVAGMAPPGVLEALGEAHKGTSAANALLLHDLARVQALLEADGLPSVALKGAALVAACYPSIGARHVGDIDLLVRPADLARVASTLERAGLRQPEGALPSLDGASKARSPGADHLPPLATWGGVLLELHDRAPGGGPVPEEILARRRRIFWHGRALQVPSPLDLAGTACVHTIVKHRGEWWLRARLVADLGALLASGPIDWSVVRAAYGAGDGGRAIDESLALLEAARREASGESRASRGLALLEPPPAGQGWLQGLQVQWGGLARTLKWGGSSALVRTFFPSRVYMEARYGLRPGSSVIWLAYPWRLLRGAFRLLVRRP